MVSQRTFNPPVSGSNPDGPTNYRVIMHTFKRFCIELFQAILLAIAFFGPLFYYVFFVMKG